MPETHVCDSCDENNFASIKCEECDDHLCEECVKAHKRMKITRNHTLSAIEGSHNTSANRSITASIGNFISNSCTLMSLKTCMLIYSFLGTFVTLHGLI